LISCSIFLKKIKNQQQTPKNICIHGGTGILPVSSEVAITTFARSDK